MEAQSSGASGIPQAGPDAEIEAVAGQDPWAGVANDAAPPELDASRDPLDEWPTSESADEVIRSAEEPLVVPPFDEVTRALSNLEAQIRAFHGRAENYEQIIRQMQSRIEQLQGDQVQALLKPLIQRFAGLHAQAREAYERAQDRGEAAEKDFNFFAVAIEESLGLVDIESVQAAPLAEFNPRKHHASRVVATDDPELDKRIQRVLRQGFTYADATRVLVPAQVSVYRYEPTQAPAEVKPFEDEPKSERDEGDLGE